MAERKIKVALRPTFRKVTVSTGVSFLASLLLWKHLNLTLPYAMFSIVTSTILLFLLFQLRFLPQMTVTLWSHLWGSVSPLLVGSLFTLPLAFPMYAFVSMLFLLIGIGVWSAYRFYPFDHDRRLHKARFARLDEMEPLLSRTPLKDSLILGSVKQFFFFRHYICARPTKQRREIGHSLIIAPSGMGKTTMIRSQIAALENASMIITDPKGELFKETAGDRAKKGKVFVLDPTAGVGHSYDPLHGITEEGEYATIAKILVFEPHDRDPYWTKSAARKVSYLFQAARKENIPPFLYLRFMSRLGLTGVVKRLQRVDPILATLFLEEDYKEAHPSDDRTLKGVWSTLTTYIDPITSETLVRCFTRSDFTPETILRGERPTTVYLRLPEEHLERLAPFVRLVIASLGKGMIAAWNRVQGRECRKVFIFHDEGGIFPLPNLDGFVSTARSKGITYNGYYQSTGQLEDTYGKEKARTIRQNMYTTAFLKPNDTDDSERIEVKLGRGSQFAESINKRQGSEFSEGLSEQAIPVMAARELEEMNENHVIIFHGNYKPMKAHRLTWWQNKMFQKSQGCKPPALPALPEIPQLQPLEEAGAARGDEDEFINPDEIIGKLKDKARQLKENDQEKELIKHGENERRR